MKRNVISEAARILEQLANGVNVRPEALKEISEKMNQEVQRKEIVVIFGEGDFEGFINQPGTLFQAYGKELKSELVRHGNQVIEDLCGPRKEAC